MKSDIKILGDKETKDIIFIVKKDITNISITGRVLSSATQLPIANAKISIVGKKSTAVTKAELDGSFKVYGLPTGRYDVLVVADGFMMTIRENVEIIENIQMSLEISLSPISTNSNSFFSPKMLYKQLQLLFISTAYASANCSTFVADYYEFAANHQDDAYKAFTNSLACVGDGLCTDVNSCKFNDSQWVYQIMNCLHDEWAQKSTPCWKLAVKYCESLNPSYEEKLGCMIIQLMCHWSEDLTECQSKYGANEQDYAKIVGHVVGCLGTFFKSLYW